MSLEVKICPQSRSSLFFVFLLQQHAKWKVEINFSQDKHFPPLIKGFMIQ